MRLPILDITAYIQVMSHDITQYASAPALPLALHHFLYFSLAASHAFIGSPASCVAATNFHFYQAQPHEWLLAIFYARHDGDTILLQVQLFLLLPIAYLLHYWEMPSMIESNALFLRTPEFCDEIRSDYFDDRARRLATFSDFTAVKYFATWLKQQCYHIDMFPLRRAFSIFNFDKSW